MIIAASTSQTEPARIAGERLVHRQPADEHEHHQADEDDHRPGSG